MEAERHFVFISHATADDPFVRELRRQLEAHGISVWVDSRNLRGGQLLDPEVQKAIREAGHVLALLGPQTVNSAWVRKEIRLGLEVAAQNSDNGYAVTPLMLPGIEPSALETWFDEEPVGIRVVPERLAESMADILAALGKQAPTDPEALPSPKQELIADLVLELEDPKFRRSRGTRKLSATATLAYDPPASAAPVVKSRRFTLTAPLGPIEADDLRWHLEQYHLWPVGVFQERAKRIESSLADWEEARDIFSRQGEPGTVATAWHQIGIVHQQAGRHEPAERAYRQSLAIKVQQDNRAGEASSLGQLGTLCASMDRTEEGVILHRQAADIRAELEDRFTEGRSRSNLAVDLIKLRRHDEARTELRRAIECDKPYGHAAEPWKTWDILQALEQVEGNRAPSLADDPALHYSDAVELRFLLESLGATFPAPDTEPEVPPE